MFDIAEALSSRGGRVGMEIGTLREQILIAMLWYVYGEDRIAINDSINQPELDVRIDDQPISIKTGISHSKQGIPSIKAIWTVDSKKAQEFLNSYQPSADILLAIVRWQNEGGLYVIPIEVQQEILDELGRMRYLKLPKQGTNPRGVEFSKQAIQKWLDDNRTVRLNIIWQRPPQSAEARQRMPYQYWLELWQQSEEAQDATEGFTHQ